MSANRIKALAVTDYLGRGNVNPFRPEAAQLIGLQASGQVDVTVMCSPESVLVKYYDERGIATVGHKIKGKLSLRSIRFIRSYIRDNGIEILHLFHSRAISNGLLAAIGLPVKVIIYRGQEGSLKRYDPVSYLNALSPRADRVVCVAVAVERYVRKQLWANPDKAITIYKGHSLDWYQQPPADLSEWQLPDNALKVALVANLRPRKGLPVLIEATRHLPPEAPVHFLLMGANTEDPDVQALVAQAAAPERIHLLGYRDDAPEVVAACDVIILPTTKREGLSRAIIEGMAYGRPAVVSDTGGNAELVADGESGYVVPASDPAALAAALESLWRSPEQREAFGREAQRRIRDIFTVEQGIAKHLQLYQQLAAELRQGG
ncbi:MAG: glycosyltransferase [Gammaproteobacteria bacterium]|nr:glycosyltransferase [Gammaproteobacteria bacterium]